MSATMIEEIDHAEEAKRRAAAAKIKAADEYRQLVRDCASGNGRRYTSAKVDAILNAAAASAGVPVDQFAEKFAEDKTRQIQRFSWGREIEAGRLAAIEQEKILQQAEQKRQALAKAVEATEREIDPLNKRALELGLVMDRAETAAGHLRQTCDQDALNAALADIQKRRIPLQERYSFYLKAADAEKRREGESWKQKGETGLGYYGANRPNAEYLKKGADILALADEADAAIPELRQQLADLDREEQAARDSALVP
jgi:hypothetical protein